MSEESWQVACEAWKYAAKEWEKTAHKASRERDEAREIARELAGWIRSVGRVETMYMSQRELANWRHVRSGVRRWLEE